MVEPDAKNTKERILDAAERLFATHGFAGTSLRAVTREASVNLAAVHYHFGSKEILLRAVLNRVVDPINRERLERLTQAETDAGNGAPSVEAILTAYFVPSFRFLHDQTERGRIVARFLGRSSAEPAELVQALVREQFAEVGRRFTAALGRALPELAPDEVTWRFHLVVAVQSWFLAGFGEPSRDPTADHLSDVDATVRRLIAFLAPGLRAPPPRS
jgi:AcrR family transcriptional regulator